MSIHALHHTTLTLPVDRPLTEQGATPSTSTVRSLLLLVLAPLLALLLVPSLAFPPSIALVRRLHLSVGCGACTNRSPAKRTP